MEPAVETMIFSLDGQSDHTIDLSQNACLLNRKFFRQGLDWAVAGFTVLSEGQTGTVSFAKIPSNWISANSWKKSFAAWDRMNKEALSESESIAPRFLDFKVFMDSIHHAAGVGNNAIAGMGVPLTPLTPGEWDYSKFIIPIGTASAGATGDREVLWTGANYPGLGASGLDAVSMIEGYAASRALPDVLDPNTPDDAAC